MILLHTVAVVVVVVVVVFVHEAARATVATLSLAPLHISPKASPAPQQVGEREQPSQQQHNQRSSQLAFFQGGGYGCCYGYGCFHRCHSH